MDAFKKLVVAGKRNRTSSVVSDDDGDNFCYHRHDDNIPGENVNGIVNGKDGRGNNSDSNASLLSLYGRRCNSERSLMSVETSSKFDCDKTFSKIGQEMIHRYEHENMSEREAILVTLETPKDRQAFLEALDLKYATLMSTNCDGGDDDEDKALFDKILEIRSIFNATLKEIFREEESSSTQGTMEREATTFHDVESMIEQQRRDDDDEYRKQQSRPKTPKNLRMSPMQTSFRYKKKSPRYADITLTESCDSTCSGGSNIFQPFKRRRRWFFAENNKKRSGNNTGEHPITPPSQSNNPVVFKGVLPKFHFDFGANSKNQKTFLFGGFGSSKAVQSLRLDGSSSSLSYMPPTSPIRKVSVEMSVNGSNNDDFMTTATN